VLGEGDYFDKFESNRSEDFKTMHIQSLQATKTTKVFRMNVIQYHQFAYDQTREFLPFLELFSQFVPLMKQSTPSTSRKIINALEEVEYEQGHLIEEEDNTPTHFYFILRGEVDLYKRPESMYNGTREQIKAYNINQFKNPKDSGNDKIGLPVGTMEGPCFVGDDAFCIDQEMSYSIVARTRVLAFKYNCQRAAQQLGQEIRNKMK